MFDELVEQTKALQARCVNLAIERDKARADLKRLLTEQQAAMRANGAALLAETREIRKQETSA